MSEVPQDPQIRYYPEDEVLEVEVHDLPRMVATNADSGEAQEAGRLASRWGFVDALEEMPGVSVDTTADTTVIWAKPEELFRPSTKTGTLRNFLLYLSNVVPRYPEDGVDHVVGLEVAYDRYVNGIIMSVYDRYQQWLESGKVGDEVLHQALAAAVLPLLPETSPATLDKSFQYTTSGDTEHAVLGYGNLETRISVVRGEFDDIRHGGEPGSASQPSQRTNDVYLLREVGIFRGTERYFGVLKAARHNVATDFPRLYEMQSSAGFANPREHAGYLLAMGVLAREAARFAGGRSVRDMAVRVEP